MAKIMKKDPLFGEIYRFDESTDRYMIEIGIDTYADIFNQWDPAPFKRRDLDADLEIYLEGSSEEIPLRYSIELFFILPVGKRDKNIEEETRIAISSYFSFRLYFLRKHLQKITILVLRYLVLGFVLLWVGTNFPDYVTETESDWAIVVTEGIFIGGWVFLWESVSLFFFSGREQRYRYRLFKRLHRAPVFFRAATEG